MRKWITGLALVALVAGVSLVAISFSEAPSAVAQEAEDEVFFEPLEDVLADLVEDGVITEDQRGKIAEAFRERFVHFGKGFPGTPHLQTVAEVLDMDVDELAAQLREGSTIADIAGDQTQDVIDALVAESTARIDEAVADGKLTEEKADEVRSALTEKIAAMVNGEYSAIGAPFGDRFRFDFFKGPRGFNFFKGPGEFEFFGGPDRLQPFGFGGGFALDGVAEALGMEVDELINQLSEGSTLADIAEERGVEIQEIIDVVLADLDEKLEDLVADERLTQERADEIREGLAAGIESMINGEIPGIAGFEFEFEFDGEFPHFGDHDRGLPFPKGFFGHPDRGEGEGFFHFHGPDGEFPVPDFFRDHFDRDPEEVEGAGTSA